MQILVILLALGFLMAGAYVGVSVILLAPVTALLAVLATGPGLVLPAYSGIFMARVGDFVALYFPVFLLGAVFGKLMETSGFVRSIVATVVDFIGPRRAILAVVLVCALLTYGGVSLFVVAFAVYPFAAELFRSAKIPKRLVPATIALGAFTFTMDALPGTPQIQNIIPTTFFHTNTWAAPRLGLAGSFFLFLGGMVYLEWRRRSAQRAGEGYGTGHLNEPEAPAGGRLANPAVAALPLLLLAVVNLWLTRWLPLLYGGRFDFAAAGLPGAAPLDARRFSGIWAVEIALVLAILFVLAWYLRTARESLLASLNIAVGGAMLATLNTASVYGFGAVIAALPGFRIVSQWTASLIHDPLVNVAATTSVLAGITGSASGGMSIALATMSDSYLRLAAAAGIPNEVLHRVTAMASGGMDTLPHNGAVITLLAIAGLTHRQSYGDILVLTVLKTSAAAFVIVLYYLFHAV